MLRGFYTAASGMLSQQRRVDMLTNNLANVNTPGYKAEQSSMRAFPEMLISRYNQETVPDKQPGFANGTQLGTLNTGVYMQETMPSFIQGDLQETGRNTDMALMEGVLPIDEQTGQKGALFFTVHNENGKVRYTKNGNFNVDGQGFLVTNEGNYVLDINQNPIQVKSTDFELTPEGNIIEDGEQVAKLGIAYAANPNDLIKEGPGLFKYGEDELLPIAGGNTNYSLYQGFIERSNVDMQQSMTDLMIAYRSFEANQKILQAYDKSLEKTVNEVGRV